MTYRHPTTSMFFFLWTLVVLHEIVIKSTAAFSVVQTAVPRAAITKSSELDVRQQIRCRFLQNDVRSRQQLFLGKASRLLSGLKDDIVDQREKQNSSKEIPASTGSVARNGETLQVNGNDTQNPSNIDTQDFALLSSSASSSGVLSWAKENIFLGIEPKPEIIAIMTIYFVEGALGLARLAQTYLLKDTLHLGPAELSALSGLFTLPWTIKPLYGFLSDGFPLWGYRRRSYLVLAGLLGCLSYTALGADFWGLLDPTTATTTTETVTATSAAVSSFFHPTLLQGTISSLILSSACIACSDVVADGIVVQRTRDATDDPKIAGGLQSLCWGSAAVGSLISAYFSGSLLEVVGPKEVFAITAVLPLLVAGIALLIDEERVVKVAPSGEATLEVTGGMNGASTTEQPNGNLATEAATELAIASTESTDAPEGMAIIKDQLDALWSAIKQPAVWKPSLFLFLWQSTPTGEGAFFYFMSNDLGMGPEFMGRVRLVSSAAGLVGVWLYQKYLRGYAIKDILFWSTIASTPLGLSQLLLITHANRGLGIPDGAFVFGDDVALAILGQVAFLPTLVLAARICPPGVEAVLFATLMSVFNGASTVGTEIGAALTKVLGVTENEFGNLGLLTVICNVSSLYPLLFIRWLDGVGSQSEVEEDGEEMEGVVANGHGAVDGGVEILEADASSMSEEGMSRQDE